MRRKKLKAIRSAYLCIHREREMRRRAKPYKPAAALPAVTRYPHLTLPRAA